MGCEQSTPVVDTTKDNAVAIKRPTAEITGVGRTERQLSKMQREAMNGKTNTSTGTFYQGKKVATGPPPPQLDERGFLMPEEVAKRTFSSICNSETVLGSLRNTTLLQYAHWTQRGYYPEDPHKQNQDEFGTHLQFAGVERDAMFAVYDGHGKQGHACSQYAKERLPKALAKHIRRVRCQNYQKNRPPSEGKKGGWDPSRWPMLSRNEYEYCCQKAFLEVNQAMHDDPSVPDVKSGTTATTISFHSDFACISNVGDSRVVLGHRVRSNPDDTISVYNRGTNLASHHSGTEEEEKNDVDDEISYHSGRSATAHPVIPAGASFDHRKLYAPGTRVMAIPLSKDHTPYRKDERDRVKASGAAVMTIDQIKGNEEAHEDWGDLVLGETLNIDGDSPRVWVNGKDYPGCAFTRSLGDSIAESVGVTAEPEVVTTELTMNDEYLVVASDGVFEFLTNQNVIDLCVESESPLMACEKIVKASYEQWLAYEKRTDDITIVVCFLQNFKQPRLGETESTTEDLLGTMATFYGERPEYMPAPPETGGYTFVRQPSPPPRQEQHDRNLTSGSRSIASVEEEAVAYYSEEALAVIVRSTTPPAAPMVDDDEEACEAEDTIETLMAEVNSTSSVINRTMSLASSHEEEEIVDNFSEVSEEKDSHQNGNPAAVPSKPVMEEVNTTSSVANRTLSLTSSYEDDKIVDPTPDDGTVPGPAERDAIQI